MTNDAMTNAQGLRSKVEPYGRHIARWSLVIASFPFLPLTPPVRVAHHSMSQVIPVTGLSNAEFLTRHALPGRIGLSGGDSVIDRAIRRAERHLDADQAWGKWSHAFLFEGERLDGQQWVIESDLQVIRKHISLGVQENRVAKYHDEATYEWLAVLDFGLSAAQTSQLLRAALDLVAGHTRYSVRELFGTLLALRHPRLRGRENLLARDQSIYCSALVQQLYRKVGMDLRPGVADKNTAPEDLAQSPVPHTMWVLDRAPQPRPLAAAAARLKQRLKSRLARRRTA